MSKLHQRLFFTLLLLTCIFISACSTTTINSRPGYLSIQKQGSFTVGGTVITNPGTFDPAKMTPAGQTFHGDHAYVLYQIPTKDRKLPLVFWHGYGQSSKTWETTPDGRDDFQNIFLRRGFGVYVIDQPRRGKAGRTTQPITTTPVPDEQKWFNIFRVEIWPEFFPEKKRSREFEVGKSDRFRYRTRYFTDSGIIGSKAFVSANYQRFKHLFYSKHDKKPKPIKGLEGIYSLKRLSEII